MTKTVSLSELTMRKMAAGNEKLYPKIIHEGVVKEWVGVGWLVGDPPSPQEKKTIPLAR